MGEGTWLKWPKIFWGVLLLLILGLSRAPEYVLGFNVSNMLVGVTALILLAYTLETQEMRRQMVLQNEIAIRPLVMIAGIEPREIKGDPGHRVRKQLILHNVGSGPALFVQAKEIEVTSATDVRYVAKFERVDYIEPGQDAGSDVNVYSESEGEEDVRMSGFIGALDPRSANKSYDVRISYEDTSGQTRESLVRMGKGGIRLLGHGKV